MRTENRTRKGADGPDRAEERRPRKAGSFMQELDKWTVRVILDPLATAWQEYGRVPDDQAAGKVLAAAEADVKKAIREKVLESYRNGKDAGAK